MRHLLVGATLLVVALAATFGLASVLQGYATAPLRMAPTPVASEPSASALSPAKGAPAGKPAPGEQGRNGPTRFRF